MRFWMPLLRRPWYLSNRVEFTDNLTGGEVEQLVSDSEIRVLQCSSPVETDTWDLLNLNLFTRRPEIELRVYGQYCPNVEFENSFKCMSGRKLSAKMSKIDLKSDIPLGGCEDSPGGMHEHWPDDFRSTDGPASADRVSSLRGALRWRLQGAAFLLPRSISLFGFCPTHLSRELARHRNLLARALATTLPHGISRWHLAQQSGPRQPAARLAHLCRLCSRAHGAGARPLSGRTFRGGIGRHGLRFRFHHRRFVPVPFSLGAVPAAQERGQNPHLAGSARAHPGQCLCDRWAGERRESARPTGAGGGGDLSSRPGLHRLSAALPDHPSPGFLRHPRRSKHALPLSRRAAGRSLHGIAFRSNHSPDRTEEFASLSGSSAAHPLLRCRERLAPRFPHQQLSAPGADHRATLPSALASRIVLSLDQTTSAPPRFLRHLGERRQDSGLGRDRGLCPGRNLEKATSLGPQFVQNSANPERDDFRKNADFIGLFAIQQPTSRSRSLYPTGSVQLMMGQHWFTVSIRWSVICRL